jgi:predicted kinase
VFSRRVGQPILVLVTGLQGSGKSTIAEIAANLLGAPLIAHDWAMSGLRPFPEIQATLEAMDPPAHGRVGWSLLRALSQSELRRGSSVVLDGVARAPQVETLRLLAADEGARFLVISAPTKVFIGPVSMAGNEAFPAGTSSTGAMWRSRARAGTRTCLLT